MLLNERDYTAKKVLGVSKVSCPAKQPPPSFSTTHRCVMLQTLLLLYTTTLLSGASAFDGHGVGTADRSRQCITSNNVLPSLPTASPSRARCTGRSRLYSGGDDIAVPSQNLLTLLSTDLTSIETNGDTRVSDAISQLESSFASTKDVETTTADYASRFEPLLGLYQVKYVQTISKKDNPVGGKWTRSNGLAQKLFKTRDTFQHLVPYNETGFSDTNLAKESVAEAINVVSLDAIDGMFRATVILRGDAVPLSAEEIYEMNSNRTLTPLSDLAVRAYFDSPRIFFGRRCRGADYSYLPLQFGPKSSVILDTTYFDKLVRIGMGGTSGSRFVFAKTDGEEAKEYEALLRQPSVKKAKVLSRLGSIFALSVYVVLGSAGIDNLAVRLPQLFSIFTGLNASNRMMTAFRGIVPVVSKAIQVLAGITSVFAGLGLLSISFSSGGIEREGMQSQQK